MDTELGSDVIERSEILQELRKGGYERRDIQDEFDLSRSTVHRIVKTFENQDIVESTDEGVSLTEFGEVVAEEVTRFEEVVETARELKTFLHTIPVEELGIESFLDSETTVSTQANPMAPLVRLAEITEEADDIRVLTNSMAPRSFDVGRRGVREREKSVEMVLEEGTAAALTTTDWYGDGLVQDLESDHLSIRVHGSVPYQMGILDDTVCIGAEDGSGRPVGMLETENDDMRDWAAETFDEFRDEAEVFDPDDYV